VTVSLSRRTVFHALSRSVWSRIRELINSTWIKGNLPQQWKVSNIFFFSTGFYSPYRTLAFLNDFSIHISNITRTYKHGDKITEGSHCCHLNTIYYRSYLLILVKENYEIWHSATTMMGFFLFATASRPAPQSTQPPVQWVAGALTSRVKRPKREAVYSPPSSAEIKNVLSYTSTPQYVFMEWCFTISFIIGYSSPQVNPVRR
jgi:hypothetical protein